MRSRIHWYDAEDVVPARAHTVVLPGASKGGPARLEGAVLSMLMDVEERGLNIVLAASEPTDLDTQIAQVCRHVYTADRVTEALARERWGSEQVLTGVLGSCAELIETLRSLPTPPSRTWTRRVYNLLKRLGK